jgi:hypothetical protein
MLMRRLFVAALLAAGLAATPAVGTASSNGPIAVAAKSCGRGYTHAYIGGAEKCLRRGEYCARRYERDYEHYGYRCNNLDANGRYHLT